MCHGGGRINKTPLIAGKAWIYSRCQWHQEIIEGVVFGFSFSSPLSIACHLYLALFDFFYAGIRLKLLEARINQVKQTLVIM